VARYFYNLESGYKSKILTDYLIEKAPAKARKYNLEFPEGMAGGKSRITNS